jgi:hypothetical protein
LVQIPKIKNNKKVRCEQISATNFAIKDIGKLTSSNNNKTIFEMRDLYSRQKKLAYWTNRIDTDFQEPDRTDVLKLVQHMQDKDRSILWIVR